MIKVIDSKENVHEIDIVKIMRDEYKGDEDVATITDEEIEKEFVEFMTDYGYDLDNLIDNIFRRRDEEPAAKEEE